MVRARSRGMWCVVLAALLGSASALSCQSEPEQDCTAGNEGCQCSLGQCFAGLVCLSGLCVRPADAETDTMDGSSGAPADTSTSDQVDSSGSATADATETGSGGCQSTDGTIDCPCLAGDMCLGDLVCDSNQTCICLSGTPCGDSDCVEDFQTDNRHCGSCGNACTTFLNDIGLCTDGQCAPTLSDCVPTATVTTCDAVCAAQGRICVAQGCGSDDRSWVQFGNELACENYSQAGSGTEACTDDLTAVVVQDFMRCCCTP